MMESKNMGIAISAVLPAHNEAENLEKVALDMAGALENAAADFEVIIVDDGSNDRTSEIADALAGNHPSIRAVHHPENKGYGAALRSGFIAAKHEWIFFTDADGQFDVKEIEKLIALAQETDFITGYRQKRMDPWHRRVYGKMFSAAVRALFKVRVRDVNCAFKLFKKELIQDAGLSIDGALINAEILAAAARKGVHPIEVAVTHLPRQKGESSGGSPKVILRAAKEIFLLWLRMRK